MNCYDVRHRLLAEPRQCETEQRAHIDSCGACAAFEREMTRIDEAIVAAATAVRLPEALPDRIMLKRTRWWSGWMVRSPRAAPIPK
jgi:hypothetical protein